MERSAWLKAKRRSTEERMDTLFASLYDEKWGVYGTATQQTFIQKFLNKLPPKSNILDAACGTGKYWQILLEQDHTVLGMDQSQGMLRQAQTRRAIALALLVQHLVGASASLEIQLRGSVNVLGWTNPLLYALLALGYAWFRFIRLQNS